MKPFAYQRRFIPVCSGIWQFLEELKLSIRRKAVGELALYFFGLLPISA